MSQDLQATGHPSPGWARIWLLAFAVATPLGWSSVAFVYFGMLAVGRPLTFEQATLAGLQDWYSWALLTPIVFSLGRRVRLERDQWVGALMVHLVCGTIVALVDLAMVTAINQYFGPTVSFIGSFSEVYPRIVLRYFHFAFIIYWVIVAAAHATEYYKSTRDGRAGVAGTAGGVDPGPARRPPDATAAPLPLQYSRTPLRRWCARGGGSAATDDDRSAG